MTPAQRRTRSRGLTLIEVLVSLVILIMISLLLYGAFDSLSRGKKGEAIKSERAKEGRDAVLRISREIQSAYLSQHTPTNTVLITRATGFVGKNSGNFDRVDFTGFAHRVTDREAKESDQAEVGYFVVRDPDHDDKFDLVRREQTPIDTTMTKGGVVNILAEDVDSFELTYLDPVTGQWLESWDSTISTGQYGRVPLEVKVTLVLAHVPPGFDSKYTTKVILPIQTPLSFAIPR